MIMSYLVSWNFSQGKENEMKHLVLTGFFLTISFGDGGSQG